MAACHCALVLTVRWMAAEADPALTLAATSAVTAIAARHCPVFRKTPPSVGGHAGQDASAAAGATRNAPFDAPFGTFPACLCPCLLRPLLRRTGRLSVL